MVPLASQWQIQTIRLSLSVFPLFSYSNIHSGSSHSVLWSDTSLEGVYGGKGWMSQDQGMD